MNNLKVLSILTASILVFIVVSCDTITSLIGGGTTSTYTVTFNINGGRGTVPGPQTVNAGSSVTMPGGNGISKSDFTFGGWNTKDVGNGINFPAGESITPSGDITLYAKWNDAAPAITRHTVTFSANGGSGTSSQQTVIDGSSITLPGTGNHARGGYSFGGWNTNAEGTGITFPAGGSITPSGDITLYVKWGPTARYETVSYNSGSGGGINANLVYSAYDNTNNYYLFLLGHINNVPLAYRDAVKYEGKQQTISFSKSEVTQKSISTSVKEADTQSVTNSSSSTWNISTEVGIEVDGFSTKVSESRGGSTGWDKTNTRSVENTYTTVSSLTSGQTDTYTMTIDLGDPYGWYRYAFFATTDVYYVVITDRNRTRVTNAFTAFCGREHSRGWAIDYQPLDSGRFAKTAGGDLLSIPAIIINQLPDPTDKIVPPPTVKDIRGGSSNFSYTIPSSVSNVVIIGDYNRRYTESEIIVETRSTPLTIELQNVYAIGKSGDNGGTGSDGKSGRPVLFMGSTWARIPDLTIISSMGSSNGLQGGSGGNGGQGNDNSDGKRGGDGGAALMADRITIMGNANIRIIGGNGGNGGRGGNLDPWWWEPAHDGGNGGNGGAAINANNITYDISGTIYALRSSGGKGGDKSENRNGAKDSLAKRGEDGSQGQPYTSTPRRVSGNLLTSE